MCCPILLMVLSLGLDWQLVLLPPIPVSRATAWVENGSGLVWAIECGVDRHLLAYIWRMHTFIQFVYKYKSICSVNIHCLILSMWLGKDKKINKTLMECITHLNTGIYYFFLSLLMFLWACNFLRDGMYVCQAFTDEIQEFIYIHYSIIM